MTDAFSLLLSSCDSSAIEKELVRAANGNARPRDKAADAAERHAASKWQSASIMGHAPGPKDGLEAA